MLPLTMIGPSANAASWNWLFGLVIRTGYSPVFIAAGAALLVVRGALALLLEGCPTVS